MSVVGRIVTFETIVPNVPKAVIGIAPVRSASELEHFVMFILQFWRY